MALNITQMKWYDSKGAIIACTEKIKVMQENLMEMQQMTQDLFEDALLMGCDEAQVREVLHALIDSLENPYQDVR